MIRIWLIMMLFACMLGGCAMPDTSTAEAGVVKFHAMLDAGRFDEIYDSSDAVMKNATPRDRVVAFLSNVHTRLGNVKSSTRGLWKVNFGTGGNSIILHYKTVFANGEADEQFVFMKSSTDTLLAGYHIDSTKTAGK